MNERSHALEIVSVIVPTYNSARTIDRAIDSVLAQTHAAWQLVIVDDASTDATVERIRERRKGFEDKIVVICRPENGGPAAARNVAMAKCAGKWIAVLDADDAWRNNRLEVLLEKAMQVSADAVCDNLLGFDDHAGKETKPLYAGLPAWLDIVAAVAPNYAGEFSLGYLKPVVRRSFVEQHNIGYDEGLRTGEDLLHLLNLLTHGGKVTCVDAPLYVYTMQVGSRSGRLSRSTKSAPRDADIALALARMRDDCDTNLTAQERQAIDKRISYLRDIAPIAEFRHARLQRNWLDALSLFFTNPGVRARLWDILKDRIRPHR